VASSADCTAVLRRPHSGRVVRYSYHVSSTPSLVPSSSIDQCRWPRNASSGWLASLAETPAPGDALYLCLATMWILVKYQTLKHSST
jgi:hypothetical protein